MTIRELCFLIIYIISSSLLGGTISGIISNSSNGQPIEHVGIMIKETHQGATSNNKGYYVVTDVENGTYTLIFSHTSFRMEERIVVVTDDKERSYVNVELTTQAIIMEDMKIVSTEASEGVNTREIQIGRVIRTPEQLLDVVQVAEPDIFRSMLTLPGVTPIADFSSGMYVRGGSPDQNQILLDDIEVYNPTHFGGLFSTFNVDAIDKVELLKGGFPAKYGGRLSSVLDVRNRDGNRKLHHGVARLSLISLQGTVEGPWKIGSKGGSYMGSYRRSYLDLMREFIDIIPDYYFYDGHAKVNYDLGQSDRISASSYFGYDKLKLDLGARMYMGWGNRTFSGQWVHIFNPRLFSHFLVANSYFESIIEQGSGLNDFRRENRIDDYTLKGILSYKPNNYHLLDFGFESKFITVDFLNKTTFDLPTERLPNVDASSITNDLYFQDSWILNAFWTFQPGIRFSNYSTLDINLPQSPDAKYFRVSPRASLRRKLSIDSNVYASYGRYYQFLAQIGTVISSPMDVWMPLDGTVKPGVADHYILGYRHELMEGLGIDLEVYYKDMDNLVSYNWDMEREWNNDTMSLHDVLYIGKGHSTGLDLLLRTDKWGIAGFVGYSFGITQNKFTNTNLNPDSNLPKYFYPKHDRNHQINLVSAYNMSEQTNKYLWGAEIIFGATYSYATGQPTAVPEQVYFAGDHLGFLFSYQDAARLPDYSRLDLSFKLKWLKRVSTIESYVQVINVTNRNNVFSRNYFVEFDEIGDMKLKHSDFNQFPLIPFIGVNVIW